jgi:hypothetical protein
VRAQVQPVTRPSIKVVLHVNRATHTLGLADRPVLLESSGAVDGGLVGAGRDVDVVVAAVGRDTALVGGAGAGVVGPVAFDHVVFDERVARPAVDGQVAVALGGEGAAVVDGAGFACQFLVSWVGWEVDEPAVSWVPSLSSDEVASVLPVHSVAAASSVRVGNVSTTVSPERVEVAVVGALAAGSGTRLDLLDQSRVVGLIALVEEVEGSAHHARHGREGEEKGLDSNHDVCRKICLVMGFCWSGLSGWRVSNFCEGALTYM